jgi:hypothetical protein
VNRDLPGWLPRSVIVLGNGYSASTFAADLIAGITVGYQLSAFLLKAESGTLWR